MLNETTCKATKPDISLNYVLLVLQTNVLSNIRLPPRHEHSGLVSSGSSFISWGDGASLALVGHPSSDGVCDNKNALWGRYFPSTSFAPHLFLLGWLKLNLALLLDQLRLI